jgi:hypothetical protein
VSRTRSAAKRAGIRAVEAPTAESERPDANREQLEARLRGMCSSLEEVRANAQQVTDMLGELIATIQIGTYAEDEIKDNIADTLAIAWRLRWNLGFVPGGVSL